MALVLAMLQAVVVAHGVRRPEVTAARNAAPATPAANRFSAPRGRSGVPWVPFDKTQPPPASPEGPEGRTPPTPRQEEHRSPPPSRFRGAPVKLGPQKPKSAVA